MLALNRVYRMAPVQELLLGIVTKRDCLGNTVDVFAAQAK